MAATPAYALPSYGILAEPHILLPRNPQALEGTGDAITVLSNGCLCCTVRDDLVAALNNLWRRRDEFDHIVIETTGG